MRDVERQLRALRAAVDWPETPDLAGVVVARLEGAPRPAAPRRANRFAGRRLAIAVALGLLVPAGAAFGDDVLRWLGVTGAEVRRVERLPPAERPTLDELGERTALAQAARRAGFRPLVPRDLGPPPEVRFDPATRAVTLVYEPAGDPLLVAQVPGALTRDVIRKMVTTTTVREVRVGREPGLFMSGVPHAVLLQTPGGAFAEDRARLAGDTLLFNRGDLVIRIESERLALPRALAIAESLR